MQFVYPAFLWALAAISIPIIIHLFHFRRYRKVVFSDIRFLKQLQDQNKSKQKLKDWLILLCRILAISALVMAFAQPFIPLGENSRLSGHKSISLFIDNSFSMNAEGKEGPLFEAAKAKARAIIQAYGNQDKFQVLTNELSGSEQRFVNKTDALARVDQVEPASSSATLSEIRNKQQAGFGMQNNAWNASYIISDFQSRQFNFTALPTDTNTHYSFIPVNHPDAQNISVDSVFLASPFVKANEPFNLNIKLTNHGSEAAEGVAVTLQMNKIQKALLNVNLGASESIIAEASISVSDSGWQKGEVSVTDFPITYDDHLFFSLKPASGNRILCISNQANAFINAVFGDDDNYQLVQNSFGSINYRDFNQYHLIILNEPDELSSGLQAELNKYLEQGGQVLIIPPKEGAQHLNAYATQLTLPAYNAITTQALQVSDLSRQSLLFKDVFKRIAPNTDLPKVSRYYPLVRQSSTKGSPVITMNNGDPLLWQSSVKKGMVYLLSVPVDVSFTTLPQHSLFVPMMLNMAMGIAQSPNLYYTIHDGNVIRLPGNVNPQSKLIRVTNGVQELVTELSQRNGQKFLHAEAIGTAGWYDVAAKNDNHLLAVAAFNNNRNESSMKFLTSAEIKDQATTLRYAEINDNSTQVLGAQISQELSGKSLWRWFIAGCLLFLVLEMALLKIK